MAHLFISHSV